MSSPTSTISVSKSSHLSGPFAESVSKRPPVSIMESNNLKRRKVDNIVYEKSPVTSAQQEIDILQARCAKLVGERDASENKRENAEKLLRSIVCDTLSDSDRTTLLHKACEEDKVEIVDYLLSSGMDVNSIDEEHRRSILHLTLAYKSQKTLHFLVENKRNQTYDVDVNLQDHAGCSPLHYAVQYDWSPKVTEALLHLGADANALTDANESVLYLAVSSNSPENVKLILAENSIDVNEADMAGQTPIYIASRDGNTEIVQLLLKHPTIDVNLCSRTAHHNSPLIQAVKSDHEQVVLALMSHASIALNLQNKHKQTALCLAADLGRFAIAKHLLSDERTDVNFSSTDGRTPLYFVTCWKNLEMVNLMINHPKLKINQSPTYFSPLLEAVEVGCADIVHAFLNSGHANDLNIPDPDGFTPLHIACMFGRTDTIHEILEHSCSSINAVAPSDHNNTALHLSANYNSIDSVSELLSHETIDVLALNESGQTARDLARSSEVRKLLTEAMQNIAIAGLRMSWGRKLPMDLIRAISKYVY
eukprot:359103_1